MRAVWLWCFQWDVGEFGSGSEEAEVGYGGLVGWNDVLRFEGTEVPYTDCIVSRSCCYLIPFGQLISPTEQVVNLPVGCKVHCQNLLDVSV